MYLARMKSRGLCLSSHFSRFFILSGSVYGMNSESSLSVGDVSPRVAAAAATALSPGWRHPVLGTAFCVPSGRASAGAGTEVGAGTAPGLTAGVPAVDAVEAVAAAEGFLDSPGLVTLLRLCVDEVRDSPSRMKRGRCTGAENSAASLRLYSPVSGSALGDFSIRSLTGKFTEAIKSLPEYLSWSMTVNEKL